MRGYGSLFLTICMALIAASAGAVLHLALLMPLIEASMISLALLFVMLTLEVSSTRRRDRADFADRLEGLARTATDIAREVGELRHRIAALERVPAADTRSEIEPLSREVGMLAELIQNVAQSVAVHDSLIAAREEPKPYERSQPAPEVALRLAANGPFAGKSDEEARALVRRAIEDGRIEIYLQPVVTLPQRKVRYYEALSRMRMADETMIEAARFIPAARAAGLLPKIDERLVHGCVQVVRRLAARNREIGLFLNIAPETLADRPTFTEILGYLEANRALASSLVLELPQKTYRGLNAADLNNLAMLAERGFRFSLDRIEDFRLDPRGLAERGVRFVKVPAELMLSQRENPTGHIHPADLADLLSRHGIELVADHIESETVVVDLLEFDVRYGQGYLFAQPRPVRAEVLGLERPAPPLPPAIMAPPIEMPEPAAQRA